MTTEPDLSVVDTDEMNRCGAETKDGTPCTRETGGDPCWQHGDADPAGPEPPEHLGRVGRQEWNRRVERLVKAGVLEDIDLSLLEQTCEIYESRRAAYQALEKHGIVVEGRKGVKKNPAAAKLKSYATEFRQCLRQLREMKDDADTSGDDDTFNPFE